MSTPLSLYPVNSASSKLTTAALLLSASGSATTAAPTTLVGTATAWGEIAFNGNTGPWAAAGTEPAPTGYGALFDASSSVLIAQMLLAGNWSGVLKLFTNGTGTTLTLDHLKLRFWKWTNGTAIASATSIGSIDLGAQTLNTTVATFTFPSTSESLMTFSPSGNDYLYIDCVSHITSTTNTTSVTKIKFDTGGASTTLGNSTFFVASPGFQPTPVLAVASPTLSFSATAGGASPANQTDALSETAGSGTAWTSAIVYGSGSGWLAISPTSDTLAASGSENVTFTCTTGALAAGTYSATVTFTATTGGNTVAVTVTFTVNPGGTLVYADSPYGMTRYVSPSKLALSYDSLALFASFTQGGTIPFYIRYSYSLKYLTSSPGVFDGWGPLDETVDKMNATPGLRMILDLSYAPAWLLSIDKNGTFVGYNPPYGNGPGTAILPNGPDFAALVAKVAQRYGNRIAVYQCGNEEYDTSLNGAVGGSILAYTMNYAIPAIQQYSSSPIIAGGIRPNSHANGGVTLQWMTNFYTYKPKAGEPKQALPVAHDFHYYDDSATIASTGYPAPDPTTTDNSVDPTKATKPSIQGVISIMAGVLQQYNPNGQIWNLENGYSVANASPLNHNSSPFDLPSQQSRYTLDAMAQLQYAQVGAKYNFYTALTFANDPRSLTGQSMIDFTNAVAATPQWTAATVPTQYLFTSVDALSFEGTTAQKPADQYFSIMNPTATDNVSWSLSSNRTWLTAQTLPTNGIGGNQGGGLTSGTLAKGQCITLKCSADSTQNGLTQLSALTGTLTITIGSTNYTITISLFVTPTAANPDISSAVAEPNNGLSFSMAVNASPPVAQGFSFTNQDGFSTWWYAFTTANWFTIDVASGNLAAGANQTINVTMAAITSTFAPGTYKEVVTVAATPFPAQYTWNNAPANTQFITITVTLTISKSSTPAVQVSTPTLLFQAVASGSLPASQTFFLHNCRNATNNWTVARTQTWLTLSPTSGSNLPANGSDNGAPGGAQATDYQVITATVNTTGLAAGTYSDTITVTLGTATQTIAVTYVVSGTGSTQTITATPSPNPLSLTQAAGGANVSGTVLLTNTGTQTGTYTNAIAYTVGSGWIKSVSPGSGPLTGGGGTQTVTITLQTGSLVAGTYTATVTFTLGSSTAVVNVTFTITSTASGATFAASPGTLAFSAVVNGTNPAGQVLTITNTGGTGGTWSASVTYNNVSNNQGWLTLSPLSGTPGVGASQQVSAFVDDTGLLAGTYTATVSIAGSNNTVTVNITFVVTPVASVAGGGLSNLLSLAVQKTQVVKVYDALGNFLGVWRDAPHLVGLKSTMNAADSPVKMTLPRKIDMFGGAGQPGTDNTVAIGNNVQIWLYGPGLPTSGLLKLNGIIDTIEPTIDASNAESVTVTITPYASVVADHGYAGSLTLTNVDPLAFFTYWFTTTDPLPGLGGVTYANPLSLSSASATSSGIGPVTYTILNQNIKSVLDSMILMLGANWFWRVNPDGSSLVSPLAPTAQHVLILGQHLSSLAYSVDNNQRKNVIRFVGSTGVSATAVGASAAPVSQGGIGERMDFRQDSRITDNGSAQVVANGVLSLLDQQLIRTKCRLVDFRGDTKTALGYDIESISVGDTVSFRDSRQVNIPSTYGSAKYGISRYGISPGLAFNTISPVLSIEYNWEYCDIEVGTFQPSLSRQLFAIRQRLQDFTTGQG